LQGSLFFLAVLTGVSVVQAQVTDEVLTGGHRADATSWPIYGGGYDQTRFSDLEQINRDNVASLEPAWVFHTGVYNPASGYQTTPVVFDGAMYVTTPRVGRDQWVIKLDARTGTERWRTPLPQGPAVFCCGANNRGATLYKDKVYVATIDASLFALNQETGEILWRIATADNRPGYSQTCAPLAFDDKIIIGVAGGEYGIRGFLRAFDADTGALLWTWHTIPSPEDGGWVGSWQETAPGIGLSLNRDIAAEKAALEDHPDAWTRGGVPIWTTPSLDPERRLVYVTTGNPGPDYDGTVRPGDNLWGDSLCAIRVDDGSFAWGFQYVPHDIWDYDGGTPPLLFDVEWEGQLTPVVGLFTKIGYFYLLNRETGALLKVSDPYVPQESFFAPLTEDGILIAPGSAGGTNWSPAAYSPQTGWVYSASMHWPMMMRTRPGVEYREGASYQSGNASFRGVEGVETWGMVNALNPVTGDVVWESRTKMPLFSGVIVTGGGLVFAGETDNRFSAWDVETGAHLWSYVTDAGCNAAPMTYALGGKQYIVVAAGGSRYLRRDRDNPVAADAIIAFALP
jgi:PQQ-dependent dehydrogenase (methanol/ethanol family)